MSMRCFLHSKIHRATITDANVDYEGSISIDPEFLKLANIKEFERVDVLNVNNGERLTTYAIVGGPGEICLNGAAAHKGEKGQKVIICSYSWMSNEEAEHHSPSIVLLGDGNTIKSHS